MQSTKLISRISRTERTETIDEIGAPSSKRGDKRNKPIRLKPAKRTWADMERGTAAFK